MAYQVKLEKFSGPLDLLLSLIEERKFDINEISLTQVTDQFLDYLKEVESVFSLNTVNYQRVLADFLLVASRLILIKSRSLLPSLVLTGEEEKEIKDLSRRLESYRKIKELAKNLQVLIKHSLSSYSRPFLAGAGEFFYPSDNLSPEILLKAYQNILKTFETPRNLPSDQIQRIMSLEEKISQVMARLGNMFEASFRDLTQKSRTRAEKTDVILTFLAILALFKKKLFDVSQDKMFGEIVIKSYCE